MRIKWDREWIAEHFDGCSDFYELRDQYNEAHGTNYSYKTVQGFCARNGYKKVKLTEEQDAFIKETYPKVGSRKTVEMFNERFGTHKTYRQMRGYVSQRGLNIECKETFKRLRRKQPKMQIGETSKGWKEEYVKVSPTKWVRASRYRFMNELKQGEVVLHLDGNPYNNDETNLQVVPKAYTAKLARNRLFSKEPMITKGAILLLDLQERI